MSADQWLEAGDCAQCRRKKYCNSQCSANKRYNARQLSKLVGAVCFSAMKDMAKAKHNIRGEN